MKEMNETETLIFNRISELKGYLAQNQDKFIVHGTLKLNVIIFYYLQRGVKPNHEQIKNILKTF